MTEMRLESRYRSGSNDTLVVVYSQVRVPSGKFGLERLFARTRHNCLFVNDTHNKWYLGLESQLDHEIDAAFQKSGATRIIHYGSSMGGYAALTTGLRRDDGAIHAFGPELRLGRPGYQSHAYGTGKTSFALSHFTNAEACHHPVHLYYGCFDAVDAANAAIAAQILPFATLHLLRSCHASHDHLYSLNIIRKIITTFNRSPEDELAARRLLYKNQVESLARFGTQAEKLACGTSPDIQVIKNAEGYGENPGMIILAAKSEWFSGNHMQALELMEAAQTLMTSDPVLQTLPKRWRKQLPLQRIQWLISLQKYTNARLLLKEMANIFPCDAQMHNLSQVLEIDLGT